MSETMVAVVSVWAIISFFAFFALGLSALTEYCDLEYHVGDGSFRFWRFVFFIQCFIYRKTKREINNIGIAILEIVVSPFLVVANACCFILSVLQIVFYFVWTFYCFIFRRKDDEQ